MMGYHGPPHCRCVRCALAASSQSRPQATAAIYADNCLPQFDDVIRSFNTQAIFLAGLS